jgi:hypothetical protein
MLISRDFERLVLALDAEDGVLSQPAAPVALLAIDIVIVAKGVRVSDVHPTTSRAPFTSIRRVDERSASYRLQPGEVGDLDAYRDGTIGDINRDDPAAISGDHLRREPRHARHRPATARSPPTLTSDRAMHVLAMHPDRGRDL